MDQHARKLLSDGLAQRRPYYLESRGIQDQAVLREAVPLSAFLVPGQLLRGQLIQQWLAARYLWTF
jgi:hypothetical protein